MGIQCEILINKTKEGFLKTNPAKGKVRYVVDEPMKFDCVTLTFINKQQCVCREGCSEHTRINKEDICTLLTVYEPSTTMTLEGKYEHCFEKFLSHDLPQSYKDDIASSSYMIQLQFETYSTPRSLFFTAEVPLYSYWSLEGWYQFHKKYYLNQTSGGAIIFGLEKELFAPLASKTPIVRLKAEINKIILSPGENAHISYEVINDTDIEITSVKTELYCYKTYSFKRGIKCLEAKVESCEAETASIPKRQVSRFSCVLPTLPGLYSVRCSLIDIEYRVRSTVKLPIPHLNATVELPVLIGEAKGDEDLALEIPKDVEHPPTCWETMIEKRMEDNGKDESE